MAVAGSRPQLRAHLDALAADLADEWEPAALYALLAEEASLAAAEARIKAARRGHTAAHAAHRAGGLLWWAGRCGRRLRVDIVPLTHVPCLCRGHAATHVPNAQTIC